MTTTTDYRVSARLLARDDFKAACAKRDIGEMFRLMQKWDGASQSRIAAPLEGFEQGRISRIMNGAERVRGIAVIERIVDALKIPGHYVGLARRPWETDDDVAIQVPADVTEVERAASTPYPPTPAQVPTVDDVIDNHMSVIIDAAPDGAVTLTYHHELHNVTSSPFTRLARQFWFKHAAGPLVVEPLPCPERNVLVQRVHDVGLHVKFACQIFPAIQPGETAKIGYRCTGGRFVDELYWRQSVYRPTKQLSLSLRLHGATVLTGCSAVEERPDGSEVTATESLVWRRNEDGIVIDITRYDLRPNQSVTLRWEYPRATA